MADYTLEITSLPDTKRGDKYGDDTNGAIVFGPVTINDVTPDADLVRVRMHFKLKGEVFKLDSDATDRDAAITITDPTTWIATVPQIQSFLPTAGHWSWDAEFFKDGDTNPLTLYKGKLKCHDDVTTPNE